MVPMESKRDQHDNTTSPQTNKNAPGSDAGFYAALALVGQVGLFIALPMVFGALFGQFLDRTVHDSAPIATIFGLLLGLAAGVFLVVRMISRLPQ